MTVSKNVCVFCGASNNVSKKFLDIGETFGKILAKTNNGLVFGGGDCGLMGAVANGTLNNGGHVTGVFPVSLRNIENEHQALSEIIIVNTMHERKQIMFERSDGFAIFPGGCGTMDEMFEILTWRQLRLHQKPIVIFNYEGYWNPLIALLDNIIANKFAKQETSDFYRVVDKVEDVLPAMKF